MFSPIDGLRASTSLLEFVPLEKRIEGLRKERLLVEQAIAALTEVSKQRRARRLRRGNALTPTPE
jgi:hypothetical protein